MHYGKKNEEKFHLLQYHSIDVSIAFEEYLKQNKNILNTLNIFKIDEKILINIFSFIASLHDLGKFSSSQFQVRLVSTDEDIYKKTKHHTKIGSILYEELLTEIIETYQIRENSIFFKYLYSLKNPTIYHHGELPSQEETELSYELLNLYYSSNDISNARKFINDSFNLYLKEYVNIINQESHLEIHNSTSWYFNGILIISDWIGSSINKDSYLNKEIDLIDYYKKSKKEILDLFNNINLNKGIPFNFKNHTDFLGKEYSNLTDLQNKCFYLNDINFKVPNLILIEDITGSGKTEASFLLGQRILNESESKGLFFALPTMVTTNEFYKRTAHIFPKIYKNNASLVLAHSKKYSQDIFTNSISDSYNVDEKNDVKAICLKWFSDGNKKSLLADIGVGTIDQLLFSSLTLKHNTLRLSGLFHKSIIIDEVHSSDKYMRTILCKVIRNIISFGGNVILMSATLTSNVKNEFLDAYNEGLSLYNKIRNKDLKTTNITLNNSYPVLTVFSSNFNKEIPLNTSEEKKRKIEFTHIDNKKDIYININKIIQKNKNILWIKNTVKSALIEYKKLQKIYKNSDVEVILLHSRFLLKDRKKIENKIIENFGKNSRSEQRKRKIVIATQIIEQSIDVDFDELITDITLSDYLIQRIGRFRRHKRDSLGNPSQLENREETKVIIYAPKYKDISKITFDWLKGHSAEYIYPRHLSVYLTLDFIYKNKMSLSIPDDIRNFIEYSLNYDMDIYTEYPISEFDKQDNKKMSDMFRDANKISFDVNKMFCKDYITIKDNKSFSLDLFNEDEKDPNVTSRYNTTSTNILLLKDGNNSFYDIKDSVISINSKILDIENIEEYYKKNNINIKEEHIISIILNKQIKIKQNLIEFKYDNEQGLTYEFIKEQK